MGVGLAAEFLHRRGAGEDADYRAETGVGPGLQVERRIPDRHDLRNIIDPRRLHCMKQHEWGGSPLRDIVTTDDGCKVLVPAETIKDRGSDCTIETRGSGHEITRVVKESSDSGVKLEQATESVATANGLGLRRYVRRRKEKKIAFALVVPFQVMMIDVLVQRPA